jgi:hypothetical protein
LLQTISRLDQSRKPNCATTTSGIEGISPSNRRGAPKLFGYPEL